MSVTEGVTQVTTSDGQIDALQSTIPKSVITLVGCAVCILIGIAVAKLVDYLHDKLSVRDDASEISVHTKQLLIARTTVLAFQKNAQDAKERRKRSVDKARDIGKMWKTRINLKKNSFGLKRSQTIKELPTNETVSTHVNLVSYSATNGGLNRNIMTDYTSNTSRRESTCIDIDGTELHSQTQPVIKENGLHDLQIQDLNGSVCDIQSDLKIRPIQEDFVAMNSVERKESLLTVSVDFDEMDNGSSFDSQNSLRILSAQTLPRAVDDNGSMLREFSMESDLEDDADATAAENSSPEVQVYSVTLNQTKQNGHVPNGHVLPKKRPASTVGVVMKKAWTDTSETKSKSAKSSTKQVKRPATTAAKSKPQNVKGRPVTAGISRPITPGGRNKSVNSSRRR